MPGRTSQVLAASVEKDGFALAPSGIPNEELDHLLCFVEGAIPDARGGQRNLLDIAGVAEFASSEPLAVLVHPILGTGAIAVRAILFDKTDSANWKVTWHQDLTIGVTRRIDLPGFGPWSEKAGVVHVQPPVEILERMLAVRIHLDDCGVDNGPVRVIPRSHQAGKIAEAEFAAWRERTPEHVCVAKRGDALLMRPMLLHASSPAGRPGHRRVLHIEYGSGDLPGGLQWRWSAQLNPVRMVFRGGNG